MKAPGDMTPFGLIVAMLTDDEGEVTTVVFLAPGPRLRTVNLPAKGRRRLPSRP